jgi:5-formyltetrahydrofolate cyclo-ligase
MAMSWYTAAQTVMFYIDVRSEVRTRQALPGALASGKKIVVPWCNEQGELELFHLTDMDELTIGMYKILEPKPELRLQPARATTTSYWNISGTTHRWRPWPLIARSSPRYPLKIMMSPWMP